MDGVDDVGARAAAIRDVDSGQSTAAITSAGPPTVAFRRGRAAAVPVDDVGGVDVERLEQPELRRV